VALPSYVVMTFIQKFLHGKGTSYGNKNVAISSDIDADSENKYVLNNGQKSDVTGTLNSVNDYYH